MIPKASKATIDLAIKLVTDSAPEMTSKYAMANMGIMSGLFIALGQDSERGVAHRLLDIDDMKQLFEEADRYPEVPNRSAMFNYCEAAPASYYLSDIEIFHGEGLRLLIDLHAWSEKQAEALNQHIWAFLRKHTERNKFDLG